MLEIKSFRQDYIDDSVKLFVNSYNNYRKHVPLLPEKPHLFEKAAKYLQQKSTNPGYAAFKNSKLVGYWVQSFTKDFMGQKTAFSLDYYSHGATDVNKELVYQQLYEKLGHIWIENKYYAHNIAFFAQDKVLANCLFRLGFGMTHFELLRDLKQVESGKTNYKIIKLENCSAIKQLQAEFNDFFGMSPLFWIPANSRIKEDRIASGELQGLAAFDGAKAAGYFMLRKGAAESWLFADDNNAQIESAFVSPPYRRQGMGKALLNHVILWAEENKLRRLYVEGESANIYGGNFWVKHFTPVGYYARRCVDTRVDIT